YRQDATGAEVYDSYIVESVDSETQLTLTTSVSPQVVVAVKTELWRTRTNAALATAIAAQVAVTTRRASPVFVDGAEMLGETSLSSSYAAAAAAGMRCAQPPHRPLTNLAFTSLGGTNTHNFSDDELDTIAARGVWIISKREDDTVVTRHQLTSDMSVIDYMEQSYTTNLDSISKDVRDILKPYHGNSNITNSLINLLATKITGKLYEISNRDYAANIGPQLTSYSVERIYKDPTAKTTLLTDLEYGLPDPFTYARVTERAI
nr:hypothetical protein [Candidatus Omnitrophota bacterium]